MTNAWTTPADAKAQVQRLWDRGRLLVDDAVAFPLRLSLRRPASRDMVDRFDRVREWIKALEAGARAATGFGYEIIWTNVDHRQLGRNRVPRALVVPTHDDALRLIGKKRQAERFAELRCQTLTRFPALDEWLSKRPLTALEHARDWDRILAVLNWFSDHPSPRIHLRQIDVVGADTKFIELRKGLFIDLLDRVLPPQYIDRTAGRRFEARFGLLSKPLLLRTRLLDPRRTLGGLSDVTAPIAELARIDVPADRIFITENETNGLSFPPFTDSAVIFDLGYAVEPLSALPWLAGKEVHYWGDIDTHGFAILDRLRAFLPTARSLLMDRETLLRHRELWVEESTPMLGPLHRLTPEESALHHDLAADSLGSRVRLEQERVAFGWVTAALERLGG